MKDRINNVRSFFYAKKEIPRQQTGDLLVNQPFTAPRATPLTMYLERHR